MGGVRHKRTKLLPVGSVALGSNAVERTLKPNSVSAQLDCNVDIDLRALVLPENEKDDGAVNVRVTVTKSQGNKAVDSPRASRGRSSAMNMLAR